MVGSRSGRERALNLPASPVCGWPSQDFLPESRWRDSTPSRPFRPRSSCQLFLPPAKLAPPDPRRKPRPTAQVPPSAPPSPFPVPGRVARLGPEVGGFSGVFLSLSVSRSGARPGASGIPRFPSEASPLSLPSPTEPLLEGSRPGPSPGREDVAPVHQGR